MAQTDRIDGLETSMAIKAPVKAATTANITLAEAQTIDGISCVAGDRVLVKDQTDGTQDGIYLVVAGNWTRAKDWNSSRDATQGTMIVVKGGTVNGDSVWRSSATDDPYVIDTVDPTFVLAELFTGAGGNLRYKFDSSTAVTEDPGDGDFRLNNATVASATVISVSDNTAEPGSPDASDFVITWDDSTQSALRGTITVTEIGKPEIFAIFSVNGTITDGTSYLDIPVAYVTGSGSFTAGNAYSVQFQRSGNFGSGSGIDFTFESDTTDSDRGNGKIWLNNATASSATVMYLDDLESGGADITTWVQSFDDSTNSALRGTIHLAIGSDPENFLVYSVTGGITDEASYSKVPVSYVSGGGTINDADNVSVIFARTGDSGLPTGLQMEFESTTTDVDQGVGKCWFNHATIASSTIFYMDDVDNAASTSINSLVDSWDDSTATIKGTITVAKKFDNTVFATFHVTGSVSSASTYSKIAITPVINVGSFNDTDIVMVSFSRTGNDGVDGTMSGPESSTDDALVRWDSTGGGTVQNSGWTLSDANAMAAGGTFDMNGNAITLDAVTLSGAVTGADQTVSAINLKDYGEVTNALGAVSGATAIDLNAGNSVTISDVTGTTTFTFSNPTASDELCGFTLGITNGGDETINWPAVDWAGGSAPTLSGTGGSTDWLVFWTVNGGVLWSGGLVGAAFA